MVPAAGQPRIVVAGEALVDLLPGAGSPLPRPGGSPANTAVALARLGVAVSMVARFSRDEFGRLLQHHLASNRVDLSYAVSADGRSSTAHASRQPDGSATYDFELDGAVDFEWTRQELPTLPPSVVALHSGSLALARSATLESWVRDARATATISLDPNLRRGLVDATTSVAVERWVAFADLVKVSTDDLALACPGEQSSDVARRGCHTGPRLVVVTYGAGGASAFFGDEEVHREGMLVDVADTIGAGDAFTAGLLHVLLDRRLLGGRLDRVTRNDIEAALDDACVVAALTCTRNGADPPSLEAVRALRP
jgi:fructokinase